MQTSLEFGFCCYFTLKYANNDGSFGAWINISYGYVFSVLLLASPIFFLFFYGKQFEKFKDIEFSDLHNLNDSSMILSTIKRKLTKKDLNWRGKLEDIAENFYEAEDIDEVVQ